MLNKLSLLAVFLLIPLMLSCAQTVEVKEHKTQNVALQDYAAKNQDEKAIVDVLQSLSDGWAKKDKQPFLTSCHADTRFMDKGGDYVTREDMFILKVDDWGPPRKAWYGYYDINIEINGDMAKVNCIQKSDYGSTRADIIMVKEKKRWLIFKYDWLH